MVDLCPLETMPQVGNIGPLKNPVRIGDRSHFFFEVNNHPATTLIDSGAQVFVLSTKFADTYNIKYSENPKALSIKPFAGPCRGIPKITYNVRIKWKNHTTTENVYIDDIQQDMILPDWYMWEHNFIRTSSKEM